MFTFANEKIIFSIVTVELRALKAPERSTLGKNEVSTLPFLSHVTLRCVSTHQSNVKCRIHKTKRPSVEVKIYGIPSFSDGLMYAICIKVIDSCQMGHLLPFSYDRIAGLGALLIKVMFINISLDRGSKF